MCSVTGLNRGRERLFVWEDDTVIDVLGAEFRPDENTEFPSEALSDAGGTRVAAKTL